MKERSKVLIPTDFTEEAAAAISYGAFVAKSFKGGLVLLHVISNEKDREKTAEKLKNEADKISATYDLEVSFEIRKGNIFDVIPQVSKDINAILIIMGTHGVKGMQHLTGSNALKVIGNSKVPFIITQSKKSNNKINDIVLPIEFTTDETKSKLSITSTIARHFGAMVHIFISKESDEFMQIRVNRELTFSKHYFDERGVKYKIEEASESGQYLNQMLDYANNIDADMIAIVNSVGDGNLLPGVFKGSGEVEILSNKYQIPTIVLNSTQTFVPESFG